MESLLTRTRSILTTTPVRWQNLFRSVPLDLLSREPAPGEWSALACLQHLIDTESVFQFRIDAFLQGKDFPAFDPDREGSQRTQAQPSAEQLAKDFSQLREQSLRALEQIREEDFSRKSRHAELGPVTLEEMLNHWTAHDLNHTIQAERALIQPFIQNCGPWQTYFSSQVISH